MAPAGSPTVRRRRLAAELRRLRGHRTGGTVAKALGWSPAKISRYELGQGGFPLHEVERLLDYYGVTEARRSQLLDLAADANARGWWEDYADVLVPEYMEYIGLEAEAFSMAQWQPLVIPGLLQTESYAWHIMSGYEGAIPTPPHIVQRRVRVRMIRQELLTRDVSPPRLSAVIDESVLLRSIGGAEVMREQLNHLMQMTRLPNVEVRILPLRSNKSLAADSFVIFNFGSLRDRDRLSDVVCSESLRGEIYIEDSRESYDYRLFFRAAYAAALDAEESRGLIETARRVWV